MPKVKLSQTIQVEVPGWKPFAHTVSSQGGEVSVSVHPNYTPRFQTVARDTGKPLTQDDDRIVYLSRGNSSGARFSGTAAEIAEFVAALNIARDEALRLEGAVASLYPNK